MEASALPASVGLGRSRIAVGVSLLRIRTDEQLVTLFRAGHDEAFRVIHDRYRARLVAYTRQMLAGSGQDAEDAVQDIFMRAYYGLRANDRQLALRAWLYRIAHNRCVDDLRRPQAITVDTVEAVAGNVQDPVVKAEQRDALWRLIADVQRLPDQQRSALLMRELSGMPYADVSGALGVSVPAVKSLLVRARMSLAQASEARDTSCARIREDLIVAHDRGVRTSGLARRHMRECDECRRFRAEVRGVSHSLAALAPTLGPLGVAAHLLGWGGGGGAAATSGAAAGGGVAAGGGAAVVSGATGTGAAASAGLLAGGATHMVTILAAAVVTAGGAVELQTSLAGAPRRVHHHPAILASAGSHAAVAGTRGSRSGSSSGSAGSRATKSAAATTGAAGSSAGRSRTPGQAADPDVTQASKNPSTRSNTMAVPISETLDPDNLLYAPTTGGLPATGSTSGTGTTPASGGATTGSGATGGTTGGTTTGGTTGTTSGGPSSAPAGGPASTGGTTQTGGSTGTTSTGSTGGGSSGATGSTTTSDGTGSGSTSSTSTSTSSGSSTTTSSTKPVVTTKPTTPKRTRSGAGKRHRKRKVLVGRLLAR